MSSFLETKLRNAIGAGFKGKLLTGALVRSTGTTVDEFGDPIQTATPYTVEGFVGQYSDIYRAQAGIPETDSKVVLILANCEVEPQKDDLVLFSGWDAFQIRKVKIDPARASATCQSFKPS